MCSNELNDGEGDDGSGGLGPPDERFELGDLATFRLLADPVRVEILEHCFEPRSVAELAAALGVPRTRLYHHIHLLEQAGLLVAAGTRSVGALTETRYRLRARTFVPSPDFVADAAPRDVGDAVLTALFAATRADLLVGLDRGVVSLAPGQRPRRISLGRRLLALTPEALDRFLGDLDELLARYEGDPTEPGVEPVAVLHVVHPSVRPLP